MQLVLTHSYAEYPFAETPQEEMDLFGIVMCLPRSSRDVQQGLETKQGLAIRDFEI